MKKNKSINLLNLAPIMIFILGVSIFLYPAISNYITSSQQEVSIKTYKAKLSSTSKTKIEEMLKEAEEYNNSLSGEEVKEPFIQGSGYTIPDNYNSVLNLNKDGIMGNIEVPKVGINLPIYHGTSEEVLKKGAGHVETTSLPIGGKNRHSIISAHRGLPSSLLFTRLDEIKIGDIFFISILGEKHAYKVDKISVIKPEDLSLLYPEKDKDLVTLLTCTPYGVNTERLLVRGIRTKYNEKEDIVKNNYWYWIKEYLLSIIFSIILIIIFIIRYYHSRRKKDYENKKE